MAEYVAPCVTVVKLLEAPFSCCFAYIFGFEDVEDLAAVVAGVAFLYEALEAGPVLGDDHRADRGVGLSVGFGVGLGVAGQLADEGLGRSGTLAGETGVVLVDSVRRRVHMDDDAVYPRCVLEMLLEKFSRIPVVTVFRIDVRAVETVVDLKLFRYGTGIPVHVGISRHN